VGEADLLSDDYAALTADAELNALGCGVPPKTRGSPVGGAGQGDGEAPRPDPGEEGRGRGLGAGVSTL
jgi:hypothetical protein